LRTQLAAAEKVYRKEKANLLCEQEKEYDENAHEVAGIITCSSNNGETLVLYFLNDGAQMPCAKSSARGKFKGSLYLPCSRMATYLSMLRNETQLFAYVDLEDPCLNHLGTDKSLKKWFSMCKAPLETEQVMLAAKPVKPVSPDDDDDVDVVNIFIHSETHKTEVESTIVQNFEVEQVEKLDTYAEAASKQSAVFTPSPSPSSKK
ncbi:MAG: hypothetical protein AAB316_24710, partial [Bacteroidota bacterium]